MSESLAKLAEKIDFSKTIPEDTTIKKENGELPDKSEEDPSAKDPITYQSSLWPWDSVRNKL
ncbi:unnamed protein product, partial [Timema podura]|nr:unnamed protein product [Timema podura]